MCPLSSPVSAGALACSTWTLKCLERRNFMIVVKSRFPTFVRFFYCLCPNGGDAIYKLGHPMLIVHVAFYFVLMVE